MIEATYTEMVAKLSQAFPKLTPQQQKAARFLLDHPEDVGLNSMRSIAKRAGVKPATISRLSRALGFPTYSQLREPFRMRLVADTHEYSNRLRDVQRRGHDDEKALYDELRQQELRNIEHTLSDKHYPRLLQAADTIKQSRTVYVLGLRGAHCAAFNFYYAYQLFRNNSQFLDTRAGMLTDQLRRIGTDDCMVAVSFPPYTQQTIDAVRYAAEAGVKVIAITDSDLSPAAQVATHTLITQYQTPAFFQSFTAALSVCQALITLLISRTGGNAVKIVEEAEEQLSRISAYW